jgi:hypothetical protein
MPANLIEYEVIKVGPEIQDIKAKLNEVGRRGFALQNTYADSSGVYTFVFSKDTGRVAEEITETAAEWVDEGFVNEETSWT